MDSGSPFQRVSSNTHHSTDGLLLHLGRVVRYSLRLSVVLLGCVQCCFRDALRQNSLFCWPSDPLPGENVAVMWLARAFSPALSISILGKHPSN